MVLLKPFKPPLLSRRPSGSANSNASDASASKPERDDEAPSAAKRRRVDEESDGKADGDWVRRSKVVVRPASSSGFRKPLLGPANTGGVTTPSESEQRGEDGTPEGYYLVLWRKPTAKKHKTWDGDGVLAVSSGYAHLQDVSGRDLGKTTWNSPLLPGSTLSVGGKDVEVDAAISRADFMAGKPFLGGGTKITTPISTTKTSSANAKAFAPHKPLAPTKPLPSPSAPNTKATKSQFKDPLLNKTVMPRPTSSAVPQARHDPSAPGALVMKRPAVAPKGRQLVDVVVDPILSRQMREHQREGVKFLYECVMGMRPFAGEGAILADEMGLGKTLQTIALVWTLLKQNPVYEDGPVIKKALIVCPVTLINNWRKEFRKWLGLERIGVFVAEDKKTRLTDFTMGKSYNVMIVGYEKLRTIHEDLKKGAGVDIVIADEGHRLKTAQNKSALAIRALNTERRIILSGTPIQNDLSEFFVMVDFVNPGLLGKYATFKREFEGPILKSRQPGAHPKDVEKGRARSEELAALTGQFILRRTADILAKYLPPKTEYVVFCRPTSVQASVYRSVLSSPVFSAVLGSPEASLQLINILKKVCNSPSLLGRIPTESANSKENNTEDPSAQRTIATLLSSIPGSLLKSPGSSAKLQVLDSLLHHLRTSHPSDKIVLVSNYTATLDLLATLLTSLSYPFVRLDGSTSASKRHSTVEHFNRTPASSCFAFLLSAKAGGMGLNLVGASRLVLFDVDWNPSTDLQAMARIHRDGQRRACRIYRLVTAGALDEKIFQRQVAKRGLADEIVDAKANVAAFSREELRDLFRLDEGGGCRTHEALGCECGGSGVVPLDEEEEVFEKAAEDVERDTETIVPTSDRATDDEDFPDLSELLKNRPALVKANEVDMKEQERRIREQRSPATGSGGGKKGGKAKMRTLMQYTHLDASRIRGADEEELDIEALVDDEVLRDLLREDGNRIDFVFSKTWS
ncbi:SNF2 family N-terminal domain-containing protein [Lineolata rhizophorae]|uniref:SNF2 family N-terminal domain-containing protein n=1 Tax=Lineolata rhizophorae TaxID=578093 RepID=A0A6A6PDD5_9PEZI|nr:SNF2 family N-terminal domain-containing protein [Lineolata rhizophorae]